jgi:hypothetical protein
VSKKTRQRGNLPCTLEKVVLYLHQNIFALFVVAWITEIIKRVLMQTVNSFVALFIPIGVFPCAIKPLADTALDLRTTSVTHQHLGLRRVASILTTVSARAITSTGMGAKNS